MISTEEEVPELLERYIVLCLMEAKPSNHDAALNATSADDRTSLPDFMQELNEIAWT